MGSFEYRQQVNAGRKAPTALQLAITSDFSIAALSSYGRVTGCGSTLPGLCTIQGCVQMTLTNLIGDGAGGFWAIGNAYANSKSDDQIVAVHNAKPEEARIYPRSNIQRLTTTNAPLILTTPGELVSYLSSQGEKLEIVTALILNGLAFQLDFSRGIVATTQKQIVATTTATANQEAALVVIDCSDRTPKMTSRIPFSTVIKEVGFDEQCINSLQISAAFSTDERQVAVITRETTGNPPGAFVSIDGDTVTSIGYNNLSPHGRALFSADGQIFAYRDKRNREDLLLTRCNRGEFESHELLKVGKDIRVTGIGFSPSGRYLCALFYNDGNHEARVNVWDTTRKPALLMHDFLLDRGSFPGECVWLNEQEVIVTDSVSSRGHISRPRGLYFHSLRINLPEEVASTDFDFNQVTIPTTSMRTSFISRLRDGIEVRQLAKLERPITHLAFSHGEEQILLGAIAGGILVVNRNELQRGLLRPSGIYELHGELRACVLDSGNTLFAVRQFLVQMLDWENLRRDSIAQPKFETLLEVMRRSYVDQFLERYARDAQDDGRAGIPGYIEEGLKGGLDHDQLIRAGFGPHGRLIWAVLNDGSIHVHDPYSEQSERAKFRMRPAYYVIAVAQTPDKQNLILADNGGNLYSVSLFTPDGDVRPGVRGRDWKIPVPEGGAALQLAFDHTGNRLAATTMLATSVFEFNSNRIGQLLHRIDGMVEDGTFGVLFHPTKPVIVKECQGHSGKNSELRIVSLTHNDRYGRPATIAVYDSPDRIVAAALVDLGDNLLLSTDSGAIRIIELHRYI